MASSLLDIAVILPPSLRGSHHHNDVHCFRVLEQKCKQNPEEGAERIAAWLNHADFEALNVEALNRKYQALCY